MNDWRLFVCNTLPVQNLGEARGYLHTLYSQIHRERTRAPTYLRLLNRQGGQELAGNYS